MIKWSRWVTVAQMGMWNRSSLWALGFDWRCHNRQRSSLAWGCAAGWVQRAGKRCQRTGRRRIRVVHRHTADDVCALTQTNTGQIDEGLSGSLLIQEAWKKSDSSSPGRMELPLILRVSIAVNGDDAHGWAGCVGDYDRLGRHSGGRRGYNAAAAAEKQSSGYTPTQTWKKGDVTGFHL